MSDVPHNARLELELAGGIALWDVSELLPRARHRKGLDERPKGQEIDRVFVHHSGALGKPGYRGVRNSVSFVVNKRNFPGPAYHFWVPFNNERDNVGRRVLYRLNPDDYRAWHTGAKANDRGIGFVFQGQLNGKLSRYQAPSKHQEEVWEAAAPWLVQRYSLTLPQGLATHSEGHTHGGRQKKTCPGADIETWVRKFRSEFQQ